MPDQFRIVRDTLARFEIPVFSIFKTRDVAVEKNKLRAAIMKVGVDEISGIDGISMNRRLIFAVK